jgi:hypothetical protein
MKMNGFVTKEGNSITRYDVLRVGRYVSTRRGVKKIGMSATHYIFRQEMRHRKLRKLILEL